MSNTFSYSFCIDWSLGCWRSGLCKPLSSTSNSCASHSSAGNWRWWCLSWLSSNLWPYLQKRWKYPWSHEGSQAWRLLPVEPILPLCRQRRMGVGKVPSVKLHANPDEPFPQAQMDKAKEWFMIVTDLSSSILGLDDHSNQLIKSSGG